MAEVIPHFPLLPPEKLPPAGAMQSGDLLPRDTLYEGQSCFVTTNPKLIHEARRLTAKEYLRRGFVTEEEIGPDGTIIEEADPYKEHSTYFVKLTESGEVAATLRAIRYDEAKGEGSFPILEHKEELDEGYVKKIETIGLENMVEVSALVRNKALDKKGTAALELYKQLMIHSWAQDKTGDGTLIMSCNPVLFKAFQLLFDGSMQRIGPDIDLPGQEAIPAMFELRDGSMNVINISMDKGNPYRGLHKAVVEYFFLGTDSKKIDKPIVDSLLEHDYDELVHSMDINEWPYLVTAEAGAQKKLQYAGAVGKIRERAQKYKYEIGANVLLAGYTALRTVGVAEGIDPVADTNWETFLAIELGTQIPYTWGFSDLIRGGLKEEYPASRKLLASTAVGSAFAAPYMYLAANGAAESWQAGAVSGSILAVGLYFLSDKVKKIRNVFKADDKSANSQEP
jgi:hypothetical protein